jgi:outer membrane protein assembly factor BamA
MLNKVLAFLSCVTFLSCLAVHPWRVVGNEVLQPQQESGAGQFKCAQPTSEQDALIREAETNKYTTRRVEFIGNNYTRDGILRRRIIIGLQEGDLFTRHNLIRSLRNVSKLKVIYPVRLRDVVLHLNGSEKTVDLIICLREKRQPPRNSQQGVERRDTIHEVTQYRTKEVF